jgi:diguanylate cyclase (GGDEF)-like protein/PAS domain S-box-containing protein
VADTLHALLLRQLQRLHLDAGTAPDAEAWARLIERVSRAYQDFDQERYLLERSQELASHELMALNEALRTSQARLTSLVSLSSDWIWEQDAELRFTYVSEQSSGADGVDLSLLLGRSLADAQCIQADSGDAARYREAAEARAAFRELTFSLNVRGGTDFHFRLSGEPVFGPDQQLLGYRGVGSDVTRAVSAERKLKHMARFDALTGLANRTQFTERLGLALARAARSRNSFALMFIDLDRFKAINDSLGHAAGDELLRTMAARLSAQVRGADLVARLGGDEFVILVEDVDDAASIRTLADRLLQAIAEPMTLQQRRFQISGSVGISVYPNDGDDAETLLKNADAAMYLAKSRGRNNVQCYTVQLASQAFNQFTLEADLRQAVQRGELTLMYQPKVRIDTGELSGLEALLRWRHPTRGLLAPGEFIELAEESGLIVPIGRWVMLAACRQIRTWRDAGLEVPRCAINLSPRQFAGDSLETDLRHALGTYGLPPQVLEVEITEGTLMTDTKRAERVMSRLHDLGIRISIDDFGTGYSSLAYLKRFPAQVLKIDRSFIGDLPGDLDDVAITEAVVAMAHKLGLAVVAEGVETEPQRAFLQQLGCDEAQGYLFGRPMAGDSLAERLPRRLRHTDLAPLEPALPDPASVAR